MPPVLPMGSVFCALLWTHATTRHVPLANHFKATRDREQLCSSSLEQPKSLAGLARFRTSCGVRCFMPTSHRCNYLSPLHCLFVLWPTIVIVDVHAKRF